MSGTPLARSRKPKVLEARVNERTYRQVRAAAYAEGVSISEWLRQLVWAELRREETDEH